MQNQSFFNTSSTTVGKYLISSWCSFSAMSSTVSLGEMATLYWAIISPESHTGGIDKKAWYQRQEACQYDKVDAVFLE